MTSNKSSCKENEDKKRDKKRDRDKDDDAANPSNSSTANSTPHTSSAVTTNTDAKKPRSGKHTQDNPTASLDTSNLTLKVAPRGIVGERVAQFESLNSEVTTKQVPRQDPNSSAVQTKVQKMIQGFNRNSVSVLSQTAPRALQLNKTGQDQEVNNSTRQSSFKDIQLDTNITKSSPPAKTSTEPLDRSR